MNNFGNQDNIFDKNNLSESEFLTPAQRQLILENLQANLQPKYRRRLEIMLLADIGKKQTQICQILGCSHQMVRYWSAVAKSGLVDTWNSQLAGRPKTINQQYAERLKELVSHSPRKYGYAFTTWTAEWLSKHLATEFRIKVSNRHINRLLKQMGLSSKPKRLSNQQVSVSKKELVIQITINR